MREILFRGKRTSNGEWVEGIGIDLNFDTAYILNEGECKVLPDTIGQYTGLTDKNGKKVFEGDIFVYDNETTYLVKWDYEYCGFYAEAVEEYNDYDVLGNFYSSLCEAIGNIHDNPELLGD